MNSEIIRAINKKVEYNAEEGFIDVEASATDRENTLLSMSVCVFKNEDSENALRVDVDDYCFEKENDLIDTKKAECFFALIDSCLQEIPNPVLYKNTISVLICTYEKDELLLEEYIKQNINALFTDASHISLGKMAYLDDSDPDNERSGLVLALHCHFEPGAWESGQENILFS